MSPKSAARSRFDRAEKRRRSLRRPRVPRRPAPRTGAGPEIPGARRRAIRGSPPVRVSPQSGRRAHGEVRRRCRHDRNDRTWFPPLTFRYAFSKRSVARSTRRRSVVTGTSSRRETEARGSSSRCTSRSSVRSLVDSRASAASVRTRLSKFAAASNGSVVAHLGAARASRLRRRFSTTVRATRLSHGRKRSGWRS